MIQDNQWMAYQMRAASGMIILLKRILHLGFAEYTRVSGGCIAYLAARDHESLPESLTEQWVQPRAMC